MLLYELLTGTTPFDKRQSEDALSDLQDMIVEEAVQLAMMGKSEKALGRLKTANFAADEDRS